MRLESFFDDFEMILDEFPSPSARLSAALSIWTHSPQHFLEAVLLAYGSIPNDSATLIGLIQTANDLGYERLRDEKGRKLEWRSNQQVLDEILKMGEKSHQKE